jgi:hypothetical protein
LSIIELFWRPFLSVSRDADFDLSVTPFGERLRVRLPGHEELLLDDPWHALNAVKHSLVEHALAQAEGVLAIHAAVLTRDDACVLLVGGSGSGKTTLCLELLDRGWRYGSDDLAPVMAGQEQVIPFPRAISLRDVDAWDRYIDRWEPPPGLPRPREPFQLPASLFDVVSSDPLKPTRLFFIDPNHTAASRVDELTRAAAIVRLSQFVRWFGPPDLQSVSQLGRELTGAALLRYETVDQGADAVVATCHRK